jgi:hypothetical protein
MYEMMYWVDGIQRCVSMASNDIFIGSNFRGAMIKFLNLSKTLYVHDLSGVRIVT